MVVDCSVVPGSRALCDGRAGGHLAPCICTGDSTQGNSLAQRAGRRIDPDSGNVVFHGPPGRAEHAARDIEAAIPAAIGFNSKLTVLDAAQWAELLCDNPLLDQASDHSRLLVIVWRHARAREAVLAFARQDGSPDPCATGRHGAYSWCEQGILASRTAVALDKQRRGDVTTRNWDTALKIATPLQYPAS